jgi:hypothetical protein
MLFLILKLYIIYGIKEKIIMSLIQNITYNPCNNFHWEKLTENAGKLKTALDTVAPLLVFAPTNVGRTAHLALSASNIWTTTDNEKRLFLVTEMTLDLINPKAGLVAHTAFSLLQNFISMIQKFNNVEAVVDNTAAGDANTGNNINHGRLIALRKKLTAAAASHAVPIFSDGLTLLSCFTLPRNDVQKVALVQGIFQAARSLYSAYGIGKQGAQESNGWKAFPFIAQVILVGLHLNRASIAYQILQKFGDMFEEFVVMRTADQKKLDETAPQIAENLKKLMAERGKTSVNFLVSEQEGSRATAEKLATMVNTRAITTDPRLNMLSQESVKSGNTHSSKEEAYDQYERVGYAIQDHLLESYSDELVVAVGHQRPLLSFLRESTENPDIKIDHAEIKVMQWNDPDDAEIVEVIKNDADKPKTK